MRWQNPNRRNNIQCTPLLTFPPNAVKYIISWIRLKITLNSCMNEFFGIRDAFSLFLFHSSRIPSGKKWVVEKSLRGKKGAHISEKNVEIERGMGFIEVSWILWAFEFRKSSILIEIEFQIFISTSLRRSSFISDQKFGSFASRLIARSRAVSRVLNEIRKQSGSRGFR